MNSLGKALKVADSPRKGARTRKRILSAAEEVFVRSGYDGATLREVATMCEIAQPGIYNYFSNKRDLYYHVFETTLSPLMNLFENMISKEEEVDETALRITDTLIENPNISPLLMRALLSDNETERSVAVDWIMRLMENSPHSRRGENVRPFSADNVVRVVALINICFGYFWASPLVQRIAGTNIADADLVAAQKRLLAFMARTLI